VHSGHASEIALNHFPTRTIVAQCLTRMTINLDQLGVRETSSFEPERLSAAASTDFK